MRALLVTTMSLAACGSQQPPYPPKSADQINQLVGIADAAFDVAQKAYAGAPDAEVRAAQREMRAALDAAQDQTEEILTQVAKVDDLATGTIDPLHVGACIRSLHLEVHDIENMSPMTRSRWAMQAAHCAGSPVVYFKAVPTADSSILL